MEEELPVPAHNKTETMGRSVTNRETRSQKLCMRQIKVFIYFFMQQNLQVANSQNLCYY